MATDLDSARTDITALVRTAWNTATDSAPLAYNNRTFERPNGSTWGRLTIKNATGGRASVGDAARFRNHGIMILQVFVPENTGMEVTDAIANAVTNAINDAGAVGNLWFWDVAPKEVGPDVDGAFFQTNVEASFTWDRVT